MTLDIRYLAGFFDGEGCFCISRSRRSGNRINNRGIYYWTLSGFKRVQKFLDTIQPHLVGKYPAAIIMQQFIETGGQTNHKRLPLDIQVKRSNLKAKLSRENHR